MRNSYGNSGNQHVNTGNGGENGERIIEMEMQSETL